MKLGSKLALVVAGMATVVAIGAAPAEAATAADQRSYSTESVRDSDDPIIIYPAEAIPYRIYRNTVANFLVCVGHAAALRASGTVRDAWCAVDDDNSSQLILWIIV